MKTKWIFLVLIAFGVALLSGAFSWAEPDEDRHGHPAKKTDPARALSPELR